MAKTVADLVEAYEGTRPANSILDKRRLRVVE
jgi:hypothetical protein